jgi:hypothetical protein
MGPSRTDTYCDTSPSNTSGEVPPKKVGRRSALMPSAPGNSSWLTKRIFCFVRSSKNTFSSAQKALNTKGVFCGGRGARGAARVSERACGVWGVAARLREASGPAPS